MWVGPLSATKRERRLRTMYKPMNGEINIHRGREPRTIAANHPIPEGSIHRCEATKIRYGSDPASPVQTITVARLRPRVGAGSRSRLPARNDTVQQITPTAISMNASCVVVMPVGANRSPDYISFGGCAT